MPIRKIVATGGVDPHHRSQPERRPGFHKSCAVRGSRSFQSVSFLTLAANLRVPSNAVVISNAF
jgi:hypothetical protein